uniref:little elongation complex subunit 1 n=1 Tax=Centroberyx gerrardi TaxID=166262 RepID=UPI003AB0A52A
MMPGENQSKIVRIAADATVGSCQNCSVLHQNLNQYVASFLALKRKITDSDHLLSEYQEKCNELQRSQSDTIRLQGQLEELQVKLVTLEKRNADYESVRAELEETKCTLKAYGQMSEEMDKLKEENNKTMAQNKKLEDQLKDVEEVTEKQTLENAHLKREKASLENDLLKTQASLKTSQALANQVEQLRAENAKTKSIKSNLENQLRLLEESVSNQSHQISQLTREKILLGRNIDDLQVRLMRLERERSKEFMSTSTQASVPEEPKVDKEKFRTLLENLWACVEPQQRQSANTLHFPEVSSKQVFPSPPENRLHSQLGKCDRSQSASHRVRESQYFPIQSKATCSPSRPTPCVLQAIKRQTSPQCKGGKKQTDTANKGKRRSKEHIMEDSSADLDSHGNSIEEILKLFKPLLPCISPVPDLDREVDSLETEDGEKENCPQPTNDSLPLQQEHSLLITTSESSHHPKSSRLPTEQTMDSPVVATQRIEHTFNENNCKHFGQHELNDITKIEGKRDGADNAKIKNQEVMQTDQWPETMQLAPSSSSSSTSDITVLVEIASLTAESEEPPSNVKPNSSLPVDTGISTTPLCHTGDTGGESEEQTQGEAGGDESACVAKMDTVASTCDVIGAEVPLLPVEPIEGSNDAVVSEAVSDTQPITSTTCLGVLQGSEVTNDAEKGKTSQDSSGLGLGNQDAMEVDFQSQETDVKGSLSEDTEVPEDQPCLSEVSVSNGISGVSDKKPEERNENDASVKLPGEAIGDEAHKAETVEEPASPIESNAGTASGRFSPQKSALFNMADAEEPLTHQESGNANDEAPSTKEVSTKTLDSTVKAKHNRLSLSDSQETKQTVVCESMKNSTHSLCRQLSPSCLLPTVKLHPLKPHTQPERGNDVLSVTKSEHLTTNTVTVEPVPKSVEEDVVEKAILLDLPKDRIDSDDKKVGKYIFSPTVSQTTSLKQSAATTSGPNKSVDSCEVVLERLSPDMTGERASLTSPTAGTPAQTTAQPEFIGQVRSEMGPPLPPLLAPLSATPPKMVKPINPRQAIGKLSFPSPKDRLASPTTPVQTYMTCNSQQQNSPSLNSPLPPDGVPSSPLQFGSATPKHAVPVPGRLPLSAFNSSSSSSSSPSQENSMRILDTMYPELSARARTLSILRGNVSLSICSSESGTTPTTTVGQMSGFKTINSSATAFTKTELRGEKRPAVSLPQPKNNKWLRLESSSRGLIRKALPSSTLTSPDETISAQNLTSKGLKNEMTSPSMEGGKPAEQTLIVNSLGKIEKQCFDLLPVIKSHLYVGNLSIKPVLRDEEKEVISEFCQNSWVTDDLMLAILNKLKTKRGVLSGDHLQALCRVYTGICRQRRDWEKAHNLAYNILREDFPDSAKLILFMVTTWPNVLSHSSPLCQAIHAVTKLKAPEEVLSCLSAYLGWDKNPPCDIDQLISTTVSEIRARSSLSFQKHDRYGDDLDTEAWEQVFTLDLLCTHKKWKWTYDNVLGKELWPLMNTWVTQPRDQHTPVSDVTVATVLRLIGRLCHLGIKERCVSSVKTVASVINAFCRHGQAEGVPWEVQLAAVYCIYDLSPCNPKQALEALAGWRGDTSRSVPPAVTSCINQIASVCRQVRS